MFCNLICSAEESKENEKFAVTASELQQCILQSQKILLQHAVKPGMNTLDATEPSHYHSMNRKYQYLPKPNSGMLSIARFYFI